MPLTDRIPVWPDSPGARTQSLMDFDSGHSVMVTELALDVHTGTHIDAPLHCIPRGATLEDLGLQPVIGPVYVVDLSSARELNAEALDAAVPHGVERLLLRTRNSTDPSYQSGPFRDDYAALTRDGADWAVSRELRLIGIDYLSIQRFCDPPDTHRVLLEAGICILEGLNLVHVQAGRYVLVCLPLRLATVEAAPARAVLFEVVA
jgi:arylformamidase